jgi:large subunit ribosomal protein L32
MANPRRKFSKARTRQRRTVYYNSLKQPQLSECPNCGTTKMLHHACPSCGHYRGRPVIEPREAA